MFDIVTPDLIVAQDASIAQKLDSCTNEGQDKTPRLILEMPSDGSSSSSWQSLDTMMQNSSNSATLNDLSINRTSDDVILVYHDQWHHILTQRLSTHQPQHHFMYPSVQRRRMLQSHTLALLSPTHITHLRHQFFLQFPHGRFTYRARQPLLRTGNNSPSDSRRAHDGFRWCASCRGRFNRSF